MHPASTTLHEILYCSQLRAGASPVLVGALVTQARARNATLGVTGLLVFDGQRFCQHLEGAPEVVAQLMRRIANDPRHEQLRIVYEGALDQRRYRRFDMGYAETEDADDMAGIHAMQGETALTRFIALRPRFDISG